MRLKVHLFIVKVNIKLKVPVPFNTTYFIFKAVMTVLHINLTFTFYNFGVLMSVIVYVKGKKNFDDEK